MIKHLVPCILCLALGVYLQTLVEKATYRHINVLCGEEALQQPIDQYMNGVMQQTGEDIEEIVHFIGAELLVKDCIDRTYEAGWYEKGAK